jgi:UDP-glucose 4-epimerase
MSRIIVTGGAGFIGTHLVKKISQKQEVIVIDNLTNKKSYANADLLKDNHIAFYKEDIRNKEKITAIFKDCKAQSCVHLAAKISVPESLVDPYTTLNVNVTGTLNVIEACARSSVEKFVFASSAAVYGDVKSPPIAEDIQLKPISPYGASKVAAEEIISAYGDLDIFESIITLRLFNIFGAGQSEEYAGVISKFKERISKDLAPVIFGDGNQQRDFISVDDVVDAIAIAMDPPKGVNKGTYNIGTGVPTKISDLAKVMVSIMGKPRLNAIHNEASEGDIRLSYPDTTKAVNILKFIAKRDLLGGLQGFVKC